MIIVVILSFIVIFVVEWNDLKVKNGSKQTIRIVFAVLGISFLYCLAILIFKLPSPNDLIQFLFQPLQKIILG